SGEGFSSQPQAWKTLQVGSLEVKSADGEQVQRRNPGLNTLRPGQAIGDRSSHIRAAQLCQHRAVCILNHGMDDTFGVNMYLHLVRRGIEQPAGLDKLQALRSEEH